MFIQGATFIPDSRVLIFQIRPENSTISYFIVLRDADFFAFTTKRQYGLKEKLVSICLVYISGLSNNCNMELKAL